MGKPHIYLDHNATTPLSRAVTLAVAKNEWLFGNASSMHRRGREARAAVEEARAQVAGLINAASEEIVFTAGGSESNNTVLRTLLDPPDGSIFARERTGLVTSVIEHPCILKAAEHLEGKGLPVSRVGVDVHGYVNFQELLEMLNSSTGLVSVMAANNEIGTVQDIAAIASLAHEAGALFHTDAVQAVGKIPVDVKAMGIDYLSLSGHKIYGPKGVGALYVRKGAPVSPLIHGGHQEHGVRAGTYNTAGIIGLGVAAQEAAEGLRKNSSREAGLRDRLLKSIRARIPGIRVNGDPKNGLPNTINISFSGAEGEAILLYLDMEGVEVSTGSACATGSLEPSYVLIATGLGTELAHGSIRFSLGRSTSERDIDYVGDVLETIIAKIRAMSTLFEGAKI